MITIRGWLEERPDLQILAGDLLGPLGISQWKISIGYAPELCDDSGNPVYGLCRRLVDNATASIAIRDPGTPVDGAAYKRPGRVVLHELGHLVIAGLGTNSPEAIAREEQAVWAFTDTIADALDASGGALGDQEILTARAMVARVTTRGATAARMENSMDKWAKLAAALAAAAEEKDPEKQAGMRKAALAEAAGEEKKAEAPPKDEEEKPPPSEKGEGHGARAAKALTSADVGAIVTKAMREERERASLIQTNAARMTPAQVALFGGMPLADVRAQIAALPPAVEAPKSPTAPAGILPEPLLQRAGGDTILAAHLHRVDLYMGTAKPAAPQAIEIDPTTGDLRLSHQRSVALKLPAAPAKGA